MKVGYLMDQLESHKNHYGWDHPVIFKLGDETLVVRDIYDNAFGPEMGTHIKLEKKNKEDI